MQRINLLSAPVSHTSKQLFAVAVFLLAFSVLVLPNINIAGEVSTQCNDGIDNDSDGLVDWQMDLGCYASADTSEGSGSKMTTDNGWTVFEKSADTRIVYVSNSSGSDTYNGLAPEWDGTNGPKKTISAARTIIRNGYPDWLLLKRGDSWNEGLDSWISSGRQSNERLIIGSYGSSSSRPALNVSSSAGFKVNNGTTVSNIAVVGLQFTGSGATHIIRMLGNTSNILFEDIATIRGSNSIGDLAGGSFNNITIRRSLILDADNNGGLAQGVYAENGSNLTLEENIFDHNGWGTVAEQNVFSHNVYVHISVNNLVARGNIFSQASSHGLQARPGGIVENNLFVRNPIALSFGYVCGGSTSKPGGVTGNVTNNVIIESNDIYTKPRGTGMQLANFPVGGNVSISGNIIANSMSIQPYGNGVEFSSSIINSDNINDCQRYSVGLHSFSFTNNIIYNYESPLMFVGLTDSNYLSNYSVTNNTIQYQRSNNNSLVHFVSDRINPSEGLWQTNIYYNKNYPTLAFREYRFDPDLTYYSFSNWVNHSGETGSQYNSVSFSAPTQNLATYHSYLGRTGSFESFITEARKQSRYNWRTEYTASVANAYFRSGFNLGSPPPPPSCTESWNCTSWSTCSQSGTQTRICTDANSCGTTINRPALSQSCTPQTPPPPSCTENWSCGAWSTCSPAGTQTRTCTDLNSCGTTLNQPALSQNCTPPPSCTESWNCTSWSTCSQSGTQTRICTDANSCGTTINRPALSQSCTPQTPPPPSCTENWSCGAWSTCSPAGTQTRTCTDANSCGTSINMPVLNISCTPEQPTVCTPNWNCTQWTNCTTSGNRTRICTDLNSCSGNPSSPAIIESCIPPLPNPDEETTCTPNWSCTSWICSSDNYQRRSCTDINNCGTSSGRPVQVEACTYVPPQTSGSVESGSLIKRSGFPEVYLVNDNTKQLIPSESIFIAHGFSWNSVAVIGEAEFNTYTKGENLTYPERTLLKSITGPAVYVYENGKRGVFFNEKYFLANGYDWNKIFAAPQSEISALPLGFNVQYPEGTLIKGESPKVYVISNGVRRPFDSAEVFETLNLKWNNILTVSDFEMTFYSEGQTVITAESSLQSLSQKLDPDKDELYTYLELIFGTDPYDPDSDKDGYPDGLEVRTSHNPLGK